MKKLIAAFLLTAVRVDTALAETYQINIQNLTSGQLFSSPTCVLHSSRYRMFTLGTAASPGLAALAEDGVTSTLQSESRGSRGTLGVAVASPLSARGSTSLVVTTPGSPKLSCVAMLGSTNDGFFAIRGVDLPRRVGQTVTALAQAYDSGSERNSESCDTVPGPPCGVHFARDTKGSEGSIQLHPGILGVGDLDPTTLGWTGPVARVQVRRLR